MKYRIIPYVLALLALPVATSSAQAKSTTDCVQVENSVRCSTKTKPAGQCDASNALGALGCAMQGYAQDKRDAESRAARLAQAERETQAYSQHLRALTAERQADSLRTELLYSRGRMVMYALADTLGLGHFSDVWSQYVNASYDVFASMAQSSPDAPNVLIHDNLVPAAKRGTDEMERFGKRLVVIGRAFADSVGLAPVLRDSMINTAWWVLPQTTATTISDAQLRTASDAVFAAWATRAPKKAARRKP